MNNDYGKGTGVPMSICKDPNKPSFDPAEYTGKTQEPPPGALGIARWRHDKDGRGWDIYQLPHPLLEGWAIRKADGSLFPPDPKVEPVVPGPCDHDLLNTLPVHVIRASVTLETYFRKKGIKRWKLFGIQEREGGPR